MSHPISQDQATHNTTEMKMFVDIQKIYLYREPVDFRKAIDGLAPIVEQDMNLSAFEIAVFVFCNKGRDKVKALYWDKTGFCLWYKPLGGCPRTIRKPSRNFRFIEKIST